jgi:uncharacterized SAM-binding protein YcdF (DUF218 family)
MLETLRSTFGLFWVRFSWKMYDWLASPPKVTLGLLLLIGFVFLCNSARRRRQIVRTIGVALGVYWIVISPLFADFAIQSLAHFVPSDTGQPADAIVVLARDRAVEGNRYQTAVSLLEEGRANRIVTLGTGQSIQTFQMLQQTNPEAVDKLTGLTCVRTTKQEAHSVATVLSPQGLDNIILITDEPHMLRSWLMFKSIGFSVIPHIEPVPASLRSSDRTFLAVREYLGLLSYALLGRLKPSSTTLAQAAQEAAADFPPERCLITTDRIRSLISQY